MNKSFKNKQIMKRNRHILPLPVTPPTNGALVIKQQLQRKRSKIGGTVGLQLQFEEGKEQMKLGANEIF